MLWYDSVETSCLENMEMAILAWDFSLAVSIRDEFESVIEFATPEQKEEFAALCRKITITTEGWKE